MAATNIQTIDLVVTLRDISPNPTSDVTFTFVDQSCGKTSEILAHKLVLACGSTVFMAQFYGPSKEQKDSIPVEDSSSSAFKVFLDVLYNKKVSLKSMKFQLLGELFYLANKYYLDSLKDSIVQEVSSRKLVTGQVLEVAKVAENHAHLEKFANALFQICSSVVKDNHEATLEMCNNEEVGEENSFTLHRLLARASRAKPRQSRPQQAPVCNNCKHVPCLHGEKLTEGNFVANSQVSFSTSRSKFKTVKLDGSHVTFVRVDGGNPNIHFQFHITNFKFCCE
eukprot:GFUD01043940.1.p1 GENE.GFUD01043940.1~~GFUD01043940.1.p1  ORF type:complete len:281 (+),score=83.86 GFUD01043940.1:66-908(+)